MAMDTMIDALKDIQMTIAVAIELRTVEYYRNTRQKVINLMVAITLMQTITYECNIAMTSKKIHLVDTERGLKTISLMRYIAHSDIKLC